jgi:hypothetical protein
MSLGNMTVQATTKKAFKKPEETKKTKKTEKKMMTFVNPKTDPDQKPTFDQKTDPDPDRLLKVNPAGLYFKPSNT